MILDFKIESSIIPSFLFTYDLYFIFHLIFSLITHTSTLSFVLSVWIWVIHMHLSSKGDTSGVIIVYKKIYNVFSVDQKFRTSLLVSCSGILLFVSITTSLCLRLCKHHFKFQGKLLFTLDLLSLEFFSFTFTYHHSIKKCFSINLFPIEWIYN